VDSRPNALRVDVIESTFSGFRTTASLFMEVVFDLLSALCMSLQRARWSYL
jgi:hypothetical protein